MKYNVKIKGQGFTTTCDTLAEAKAEVKRIVDKVPHQKQNVYIDEYAETAIGIATGVWYRYNPETKTFIRNTV